MEETGENWPSDLGMGVSNNNFCFDDEELACDDDESNCFDDEMGETHNKKRRELKERLLALSATIPGLKKKMDDTSILDKASTYVKQLQQRVRELEQKVESRKYCTNKKLGSTSNCDEEVSSDYNNYYYGQGHNNNTNNKNTLLEVKARVMQKQVLVTVHCEKQNGIMLKILSHLENLHLSIVNSSVLPFGKFTLDITIIAQMGDGYNMTVDELVKSLRLAILTH